jgi:hypothetical protein
MNARETGSADQNVSEALRWIIDAFARLDAQYQVVGGLAARAYGATRPLIDLDFYVRSVDLPRVLASVADACVWGPEHFKDENWDVTFAKLEKHGVQIELAQAEGARYYSRDAARWMDQDVAFDDSQLRSVLGTEICVMPKNQLVAYKRALNRPVDRLDLQEMATEMA